MRYNVCKFSKYHCDSFFCWIKKCQLDIHVVARVVYFLHVGWGAGLLKIVKVVLHRKVNIVLTLKISIWLHLLEEPHLNLFSKNFTFFTFSLAGMNKPQATARSNCSLDIVYPCKNLSIIWGDPCILFFKHKSRSENFDNIVTVAFSFPIW